MSDANAASGSPNAIPAPDRQYAARAERAAGRALFRLKRIGRDAWYVVRFALFVLYLVLAIVGVWMWAIGAIFNGLRLILRALMVVVLWLSGGVAPTPGAPPRSVAESIEHDLRHFWNRRIIGYQRLSRHLAEQFVSMRRATRTFWHWSFARQLLAVGVAIVLIGLPLAYIVPRPHYVQVTDDNAIQYEDNGKTVTYLIHAVDLFKPGKTREYKNEDAVHLGKFNSQGVKAQIVPGRNYRLWVVGIRWWKFPTLYPNILKAQEIDAHGNVLKDPARTIPMVAPQ